MPRRSDATPASRHNTQSCVIIKRTTKKSRQSYNGQDYNCQLHNHGAREQQQLCDSKQESTTLDQLLYARTEIILCTIRFSTSRQRREMPRSSPLPTLRLVRPPTASDSFNVAAAVRYGDWPSPPAAPKPPGPGKASGMGPASALDSPDTVWRGGCDDNAMAVRQCVAHG